MTDKTGIAASGTSTRRQQYGRVGWILLWLIGIPLPVLLALFLLRGCT